MNIFVAEHHKGYVKSIVLSPDEKTFVSISWKSDMITSCICDSETGHCISGPFESYSPCSIISRGDKVNGCFSSDGKHILVRSRRSDSLSCRAVVWDIERGKEVFQIEGFDFVFIHCGRNKGRIASMDWIDEDRSLFRKIVSLGRTRILVKLWDVGNDKFGRLFEVTGIAVVQFSPDGQYLAVGRWSKNTIELWNLEDGKITHRFPYSFHKFSSLHFSPTSDCLMATSYEYKYRFWKLDTQEMTSFDPDFCFEDLFFRRAKTTPAIIRSPNANRLFIPGIYTVKIWEVAMGSSNMIFKTEPLTSEIGSVCPSRDGHRFLVGSDDGTVMMRNMEDFGSSQSLIQDVTNTPEIIAFLPSGKMVATKSQQSTYLELRDTTTWELVWLGDVGREYQVAFSADDKRIAVLTNGPITICDVMHPDNRLSLHPFKIRHARYGQIAFQTCDDLVICAWTGRNSGLLQVWKLKDHSERTFSLHVNIEKCWPIFLAPDGLTLIITYPISCYSWNHKTAQFDRIHFTDEAHLDGYLDGYHAYSPDGKLFACRSREDKHIRVWDTRTGQLCGRPITMPDMDEIALSPALNDQSLGDQLIAIHCDDTYTITLFDVYTGHLCAQFWDPGKKGKMTFIGDGTKLASYSDSHTIRIHDIMDLAAKHGNVAHGYEPVPKYMKGGWMVGQVDELLFWVPLERREDLCLSHLEVIGGRPTKMDLSRLRYGSKWTECIDQVWLNQLEEREKEMVRLLE